MDILIVATNDDERAELDLPPRKDPDSDPFGSVRLEGMVDYAVCGRRSIVGMPSIVCCTRVSIAQNGVPDLPGLLAAIRHAEELVRMHPRVPIYTLRGGADGDDSAQRE